jgi:hypothetical protein
MMEVTVWTISSCLPDRGLPVVMGVYGAEAEARAAWDISMRDAWNCVEPKDTETGEPQKYPDGDPDLAHAILADCCQRDEEEGAEIWGRYRFLSHTVAIPHEAAK